MTDLLRELVLGAKDEDVNPKNWECHFYGVWDMIIGKYFANYVRNPQHMLVYQKEDRDFNIVEKKIIPDFTVSKYHQIDGERVLQVFLVIKNKPSPDEEDDAEKDIADTTLQLEEQINAAFLRFPFDKIFGVIAAGQYWKYYTYSRQPMRSDSDNDDYIPSSDDIPLGMIPDFESDLFDLLDAEDRNTDLEIFVEKVIKMVEIDDREF